MHKYNMMHNISKFGDTLRRFAKNVNNKLLMHTCRFIYNMMTIHSTKVILPIYKKTYVSKFYTDSVPLRIQHIPMDSNFNIFL